MRDIIDTNTHAWLPVIICCARVDGARAQTYRGHRVLFMCAITVHVGRTRREKENETTQDGENPPVGVHVSQQTEQTPTSSYELS